MKKYLEYTKSISQYFTASLIPMLLNLAINPLVSLAMEPEDFAIVGYFTSFTTLISPIISFYFLHYYNKRYFELDQAGRLQLKALLFKALIFFSLAVSVVCLIGILVFIKIDGSNQFATFPYLYMAVFSIPLTGIYNLELADLKMERKSKEYMNLSVTCGCLGVGTTLLFVVLFKWGAFGKLLGPMAVSIAMFIYLLSKHKELWMIRCKAKDLIPILKFCWPLAAGAALGYFSNGYDKTMLENLGNVNEFGYYCVGSSIAAYLGVFSTSISSTFQADTYEAIISRNNRKLIKVTAVRWFLTLIVVVGFIVFCPLVIRILTAGKYMASTGYARILSLVSLSSCIYYVINDYTIGRGKPFFYTITTILGSIAIIVLMPIAIDRWQFNGAAIMMVMSFVIFAVINTILLLLDSQIRMISSTNGT